MVRGATERAKGGVNNERQRGVDTGSTSWEEGELLCFMLPCYRTDPPAGPGKLLQIGAMAFPSFLY